MANKYYKTRRQQRSRKLNTRKRPLKHCKKSRKRFITTLNRKLAHKWRGGGEKDKKRKADEISNESPNNLTNILDMTYPTTQAPYVYPGSRTAYLTQTNINAQNNNPTFRTDDEDEIYQTHLNLYGNIIANKYAMVRGYIVLNDGLDAVHQYMDEENGYIANDRSLYGDDIAIQNIEKRLDEYINAFNGHNPVERHIDNFNGYDSIDLPSTSRGY